MVHLQAIEDVVSVIRLANETRAPLCLDWEAGASIDPAGIMLDVSRLNGVKNYRSEEFLIHLEAGMTMGQLAEVLDAQDQRMALTYSPSRRLLSVLGEETPSLSATRCGHLRQWVMGLEAVTGDGERIHYGAEVVKNVTGYDMNKLFVGSHHRYGLITRVILKVEPKAEMIRSFLFHVEAFASAVDLLRALRQALSNPEILALFKTKTSFGWQILVTLSGYREIVQQESESIRVIVSHLKSDLQELHLAPKSVEQWIQRLDWLHPEEPDALVIRIALPQRYLLDLPARFPDWSWFQSADMLLPMETHQLLMRWISVHRPGLQDLESLQAQITQLGGFVEVLRSPPPLRREAARFNADPHPAVRRWERELKAKFDPHGVLPGGKFEAKELLTPEESLP